MTVDEQNKLNKARSIGSMASADSRPRGEDPLDYVKKVIQERDEISAEAEAAAAQIDGQQALPGFEPPPTMDADSIKRNIGKINFQMDYLKDPEDALIEYNAPQGKRLEFYKNYMQHLVEIAAKLTGADPEQLADKERRTPEQNNLLSEIAGRLQLARLDAFFASRFVNALTFLDAIPGEFEKIYPQPDNTMPPQKVQTVLYFFAIHEEISPTAAGTLTEQQKAELLSIFSQIDNFYCEQQKKTGEPIEDFRSLLYLFIESQYPTEEAEEIVAAAEAVEESLPRITTKQAELLNYPLDKPNSNIWKLLAEAPQNGQYLLEYEFNTTRHEDKKKGKEAIIYVAIDFNNLDGVKFTKQLTPFDKRVYIAANALRNAGNEVMTVSQIHKMMGNRGQPSATQIEKINESLDKMRATIVHINSEKEANVYKGYKRFVYDGALIEFRRVSVYIDNIRTDAAIKLLAEPPLITFAKKRNQITNVPRLLLESPISKTDANLMIDDYLIERILHMKNQPKLSRKILFSKIFEQCQIKTRMQRTRAPEKIRKYLDHYKKCKVIAGYKETEDGVTIQF